MEQEGRQTGAKVLFMANTHTYASDPHPPHTRQKYEPKSGQNMTPDASKQGKFGSLGAAFLFIVLPCMWGLGFRKEPPNTPKRHPALHAPCPAMSDRFLLDHLLGDDSLYSMSTYDAR